MNEYSFKNLIILLVELFFNKSFCFRIKLWNYVELSNVVSIYIYYKLLVLNKTVQLSYTITF